MNNTSYSFKLGKIKAQVVSDGFLIVPPPPSERSSTASKIPKGEEMGVLSLYLEMGKDKVLIDTGCGDKFMPTTGKLVSNLKAAKINPEDINVVVFTHGHIDHAAGTFTNEGKPIFPKARYIASKKEWQCWVDRKERRELTHMFSAARKDLLPIPEQFYLAEEGEEILPGIVLTTAPGHTPGSAILRISSDGAKLNCLGDLIHSFIEFDKPDYYAFLDTDPEQAASSRNRQSRDNKPGQYM